jgi:hypothetical protein
LLDKLLLDGLRSWQIIERVEFIADAKVTLTSRPGKLALRDSFACQLLGASCLGPVWTR